MKEKAISGIYIPLTGGGAEDRFGHSKFSREAFYKENT